MMEMFRSLGSETLSADDIARDVLEPGTPGLEEVIREFGESVLTEDGRLHRGRLGDIVFRDDAAREKLNAITHPRIIADMEARIAEFRAKSGARDVMVVEIPLLVECGLGGMVDKIIVVAAEQQAQINRLTTRGLSIDQAVQRVQAQMPVAAKLSFADWVIRTDAGLDDTMRQVREIWHDLCCM